MVLEIATKFPEDLFMATQAYLSATFKIPVDLGSWSAAAGLPLILANGFDFRRTELLGHEILVASPRVETVENLIQTSKRLGMLAQHFNGTTVLVLASISAYQRGRLIEEATPFIVPGNQLFIPHLAMDLKEHFRLKRRYSEDQITPASQALLLRHLMIKDVEDARPSDLAAVMRYSAMSIGRAFEELEAHGLARVKVRGRGKHITFNQPSRDLFEAALPRLRSPVKAEHWFRSPKLAEDINSFALVEHLQAGGESALAQRSTMSRPRIMRFAAGPKDWNRIQSSEFTIEVSQNEDPDFGVDAWWYDPDIVSGGNDVDALSLYLQFRNHPDERLEAAADQLLEDFQW